MSTDCGSLDAAACNRIALLFHDGLALAMAYGTQGRAAGNPDTRSMVIRKMGWDMEELAKKILGSMKQLTKMPNYERFRRYDLVF